MNGLHRIGKVTLGVLTVLCGLLMALDPGHGLHIALLILGITLLLAGIRYLRFYRSMARHMIGGRSILILGVILLDFGIFTLSLHSVQIEFLTVYLLAAYAFSGVVDILGALEARGYEAKSWRMKMSTGIVNILVAAAALFCGVLMKSPDLVVYIYSFGLIHSGVMRIISAFRRTAIVYIQ